MSESGEERVSSDAAIPFAVTPDIREVETLDAFTDAQLDERLGFKTVHITASDDASVFVTTERFRREWTIWVLLGVLLLSLGEVVLAWLCGRGW